MRQSVNLITAPTTEPVSLSDVKTWARIDGTDEDALLTNLIVAARQEAEKFLRSALVNQTWELTLDLACGGLDSSLGDGMYDLPITALYGDLPRVIKLPYAPVSSITSVKYFDLDNTEATYSSSNYTLDSSGGRLLLNYSAIWPSNLRKEACVKIRYVAGYGTSADVPMAIKMAIIGYVHGMYESRGICDTNTDPLKEMQIKLMPYRKVAL